MDFAGSMVVAANGRPSVAAAGFDRRGRKETVSKRNRAELRRRRLEIKERMEVFLRSRGELTAPRLHALNQARFEIARGARLEDPAEARQIVNVIERRQPGFVPAPPAARRRYRLLYQTLGFSAAERIAAFTRGLTGKTAS